MGGEANRAHEASVASTGQKWKLCTGGNFCSRAISIVVVVVVSTRIAFLFIRFRPSALRLISRLVLLCALDINENHAEKSCGCGKGEGECCLSEVRATRATSIRKLALSTLCNPHTAAS